MQVIFVCTGNTCRSPMAEGLLKNLAVEGVEVISRGLFVPEESRASFSSEKAMKSMGIDISSHISKQLTMDEAEKADLILTMTSAHKKTILNANEGFKDKTFTLCEAAGESGEIDDPYGRDDDVYFDCAQHMSYLIEKIDWNGMVNDKKSK